RPGDGARPRACHRANRPYSERAHRVIGALRPAWRRRRSRRSHRACYDRLPLLPRPTRTLYRRMALPPFPQTEFQRLAPAEKIQTGRVTLAFLGTTRVAITRTSDGQVRVFKNVCPHAGSPLSGGCIEHDE